MNNEKVFGSIKRMKNGGIATEILQMIIGTWLMGVGLSMFLVPFKIASGGVSGLATVIHYLCGIKTSVLVIALNIPIYVIAFICFDFKFFLRSLAGTLLLSLFMDIMSYVTVDIDDTLLACVFGGAILGLGISFVMRSGGTTGGTDVVVLVVRKFFPNLSVGQLFLVIDGLIVAFAGAVFSSWEVMLYSAAAICISSYVTDTALDGLHYARLVYIMSDMNREITEKIYADMNRGVTGLASVSMYTGKDGKVLLCAVRKYELTKLKRIIHSVDEDAFIIVSDAKEVLGNGFDAKMIK